MGQHRVIRSVIFGAALCVMQVGVMQAGVMQSNAFAQLLSKPLAQALSQAHAQKTPPEGMPQYGAGRYGRYLILPAQLYGEADVAANTPYRLFLTAKKNAIHNTPSQDGILHGVTDEHGRTAWVWTDKNYITEEFTLLRRVGDAPWGTFYQLSSSSDSEPLTQWPYVVSMQQRWGPKWMDIGYTNADGSTAYVTDSLPAGPMSVSGDATVTYDRVCFDKLTQAYHGVIQNDAAATAQALAQLPCEDTVQARLDVANLMLMLDRRDLAGEYLDQTRTWKFMLPWRLLDDTALTHRLDVEKLLGRPQEALADARQLQQRQFKRSRHASKNGPDWANNIAYYLADFDEYLPEAEAQARTSIRRAGKLPYNQGTLGWILFRRGDVDAGLQMMQTAFLKLPRDEEMVADLGLALWRSNQEGRALTLWHQAEAQCVWGRRLHDAMLEASYPHPLFLHPNSDDLQAYLQRCKSPRMKEARVAS